MRMVVCALMMSTLAVTAQGLAQNLTTDSMSGSTERAAPDTLSQPTKEAEPGLYGSKIIGLNIVDKGGERIGSIKDMLIANNRLQKYVIATGGGIAGIGEKDRAVDPDKITFEHDPKGNLQARVALSKEEVQGSAEYKY